MRQYFTKSLFTMAVECPTKLYYKSKSNEYADKSIDDSFLQALAEGGFQVGALAKCYYPEGIDLQDMSTEQALLVTVLS